MSQCSASKSASFHTSSSGSHLAPRVQHIGPMLPLGLSSPLLGAKACLQAPEVEIFLSDASQLIEYN